MIHRRSVPSAARSVTIALCRSAPVRPPSRAPAIRARRRSATSRPRDARSCRRGRPAPAGSPAGLRSETATAIRAVPRCRPAASSALEIGAPITPAIAVAVMNKTDRPGALPLREPLREVQDDAGKETRLPRRRAESESRRSAAGLLTKIIADDSTPHVNMMRAIHTRAPKRAPASGCSALRAACS